jgi:hypothetical protein
MTPWTKPHLRRQEVLVQYLAVIKSHNISWGHFVVCFSNTQTILVLSQTSTNYCPHVYANMRLGTLYRLQWDWTAGGKSKHLRQIKVTVIFQVLNEASVKMSVF